jgi:beta-lactamase class A
VIPVAVHADHPPAQVAHRGSLRPPAIVSPAPREISYGWVSGHVFAGTTRVAVWADGTWRESKNVSGPADFSFSLHLHGGDARIRIVAKNARGDRASTLVRPVFGLPRAARPERIPPASEDRSLARRVRRLLRSFSGTAAGYVQDLQSGRGAAWNARARFPAASTLKLAIAIEVLRRLPGRPARGSILAGLLWRMLVHSDNSAANTLLVWLGGSTSEGAARVNRMMNALGIRDSLMYGGYAVAYLDTRSIPLHVNEQPSFRIGKYTTAWDLARLHRDVHLATRSLGPLPRIEGTFGRKDARYLLYLLACVVDHGKLDRYLPAGATLLHKAGWITQARHDSGLVFFHRGSFVVAVMTWNAGGVGTSSDTLAGRVARRAFDRFRGHRSESTSLTTPSAIS